MICNQVKETSHFYKWEKHQMNVENNSVDTNNLHHFICFLHILEFARLWFEEFAKLILIAFNQCFYASATEDNFSVFLKIQ